MQPSIRRASLGILTIPAMIAALTLPSQAADSTTAATTTTSVSYFSETPLDPSKTLTRAQVDALTAPVITPAYETGYKLRNGNKSTDYMYQSADVFAIHVVCTDDCITKSQVRLSLGEYINGGSSKLWKLTLLGTRYSGTESYTLSYNINCGVNINNATDQFCSTWKADGSDPADSGPWSSGDGFWKSFGSTAGVTKYPMVKLGVRWSDGTVAIGDDGNAGEKFRGWDVCVKSSPTKLCATTGKG